MHELEIEVARLVERVGALVTRAIEERDERRDRARDERDWRDGLNDRLDALEEALAGLAARLPVAPTHTERARTKWGPLVLRAIPFLVVGVVAVGAALGIQSCVAVENKLPGVAVPAPSHEAKHEHAE